MARTEISRRRLLQYGAATGALTAVEGVLGGCASRVPVARPAPIPGVVDLWVAETPIRVGGRRGTAVSINGTVPGPVLRFREGQDVTIRVTNALDETTSIHWHGIILPAPMDGVPGVSFAGIPPRQSFTYRFTLQQYGTYWYHSHSAFQEQRGMRAPLVIDPIEPDPVGYDREHVVMLSEWTFENPHRILANLKKYSGYYNFQRRTLGDFIRDAGDRGFWSTLKDRFAWARMRMDPTDLADVTGATLTFLINGRDPSSHWSGLFPSGERVRLRFINAAATMTFDVRIPGLAMTVVQADGQNVRPVRVDEMRIAPAETYDVIVEPGDRPAYALFAEALDRSGFASAMLVQRAGAVAPLPPRRERPVRSMADMGHGGMAHGGHAMGQQDSGTAARRTHQGHRTRAPQQARKQRPHEIDAGPAAPHAGHEVPSPSVHTPEHGAQEVQQQPAPHAEHAKPSARPLATRTRGLAPPGAIPAPAMHGPDTHGPGNASVAMMSRSRLNEPGIGLSQSDRRVLVYSDLVALEPHPDQRPPSREIELHLTGNMERFMWSINGKKFSEAEPIRLELGERVRITFVNDTMMEHPMHLHGMWMVLENGAGTHIPRKHTIQVKPAERLSFLVTADNPGPWAFHCHILYHMEAGMFRVVQVVSPGARNAR